MLFRSEITLGGSAVLDAQLFPGAPILIGRNTYRYLLADQNPDNALLLFGPGELRVTFAGAKFKSGSGEEALDNFAKEEVIQLVTHPTAASASNGINVGPLSFQSPTVSVQDFSFKDGNLAFTLTFQSEGGSFRLGGTGTSPPGPRPSEGFIATLENLFVSLNVGSSQPGDYFIADLDQTFPATGGFHGTTSGLHLTVPSVVAVDAGRVAIHYDPNGASDQEDRKSTRLNSSH